MAGKQRIGIGCVRVSTDRQERSIDEQKESIRAVAARDGVMLLEGDMWCVDEGVSGSILDRPGLQKLLTFCRTRPDITDVYFWKRNRLTRSIDPLDGLSIERQIEKAGKKLHFVQGIQKTGNRLLDFIASGIEYAEAGQYLVNLSSDTIRGLVPLTQAGFDAGRPTPYGFDRKVVDDSGRELYRIRDLGNGIRHKIMPSGEVQVYENNTKPMKDEACHSTLVKGAPDRVAVVRRIFEAYVYQEKGIRAIAQELNEKGIPSARGGDWSMGTIRSIIVNPVYYGANVWNIRTFSKYHAIANGRAIPLQEEPTQYKRQNDPSDWIVADEGHGFEPIISKELFDLAQAKRKSRNYPFGRGKAITVPYYLSGLLVCSCGNHLQGTTRTSGKKKGCRKYYYYVCGGFKMKGHTVCRNYHLPKDHIEKPVLNALARRLRSLGRIENIRAQVKELLADCAAPDDKVGKAIRQRIAELEERSRKWSVAIEQGLNVDTAISQLNRLAQEKKTLEQELASATERRKTAFDVEAVSKALMADLDRLEEVLEQGSVAEVKAILRTYIGKVEYDPENNTARVGFYKLPARAGVPGVNATPDTKKSAQKSAFISVVAGVGFEPTTSGL